MTSSSNTSPNSIPSSFSSIANYDIGQQLGKGGFAIVYQGRYRYTPPSSPSPLLSPTTPTPTKTSSSSSSTSTSTSHSPSISISSSRTSLINKNIAIKFINKSRTNEQDMTQRVFNEIKIHSSLNHPSIVRLFHYFEDQNYYYLLLELCPQGTLFHYLKRVGPLNESLTAKYCYQILQALEYLQSLGVIHRDMKLSNLLLDENYNLKLCDFGLAVQLEHPDEEHFTICGTPNYIAPEIASQKSHGFPADIWSLGCLCYSMLTGGTLPFAHKGGVQETLKQIVAGEYSIPSHIQISQSALSFLGMILHVDPFHRASCTQLMNHPFILSNVFVDPSSSSSSPSSPSSLLSSQFPSKSLKIQNQCDVLTSPSLPLPTLPLPIPLPSPSRSPQIHLQDSVSSHTASTALQSYEARSQNTNQTSEPYSSGNNAQKREKELQRSAPILEYEEYQEKTKKNNSVYEKQTDVTKSNQFTKQRSNFSNGLMPPKVSQEPEIHLDQQRRSQYYPVATSSYHSNQLELREPLNYPHSSPSNDNSISHSVTYLSTPRQHNQTVTSPTLRHSHDGVMSRNRASQSSQAKLQQLLFSPPKYDDQIDRRSNHSQLFNQSVESGFQYLHSSVDSMNGSVLSLSLSSVGSSNHRSRQGVMDTSYERNPLFSPSSAGGGGGGGGAADSTKRRSKYSSSSTVSSLSPQSPDNQISSSSPSHTTPVLWTQRLSKRFGKDVAVSTATKTLSFCYCSPQGDVLAISSGGDVVYCTYLPDCNGKFKPCRLCVRSNQPLILSLGKVNHEMCQTIKSLTSVYGPNSHNSISTEQLLQQEGIFSSNSNLQDQHLTIFDDVMWIKQYRINQLEGRLKKVYYRVYDMIQMAKKKIPKLILYLVDSKSSSSSSSKGITSSSQSSFSSSRHDNGPSISHDGGGCGNGTGGGVGGGNGGGDSGRNNGTVVCKCMLMSNIPFPDFYVRWSDGMKLHYTLSDGRLVVNNSTRKISSSSSSSSLPLSSSKDIYRWDHQGMRDGTDWTISAPEEIKIYLLQAQKAMKRCLLEDNQQWNSSSNSSQPTVIVEKIQNLQ